MGMGTQWRFLKPPKVYPTTLMRHFNGVAMEKFTCSKMTSTGNLTRIGKKETELPQITQKRSHWDLPSNIDGATQWSNRKTYFFKNGKYYRFDDGNFTIDSSDDPFPRDAGKWWFGCQREETRVNGPKDVGLEGECPKPSYKYEQGCCCGDYCCWDKCRWKDPPQECLNGIYNGKWVYDSAKDYYYAVSSGQ